MEYLPTEMLVCPTAIPNLYVLPGSPREINPKTPAYSRRIARLLRRRRNEFELILIDPPACFATPDAHRLAQAADGVVLVLREGSTKWRDAMAAVNQFTESSIPILGTILNDWDAERPVHQPSENDYFFEEDSGRGFEEVEDTE